MEDIPPDVEDIQEAATDADAAGTPDDQTVWDAADPDGEMAAPPDDVEAAEVETTDTAGDHAVIPGDEGQVLLDSDGDGVPDGLDCAPFDPDIAPGKVEACDGKDNDCNGKTDESFTLVDWDGSIRHKGETCGIGNCSGGSVMCAAGGQALECSTAPAKKPEECNGLDDDCNGAIDDGVTCECPDDGLPCTAEVKKDDKCASELAAGWCIIGGTCWASSQHEPGNICRYCDSAKNQYAWTLLDPSFKCDDGNQCTSGEHCSAAGTCEGGSATSCNDFNQCTIDSCDLAMGCVHTAVSGPCDDGNQCTIDDKCGPFGCSGMLINCSSMADQCNDGACKDGACVKSPKGNWTGCNDQDDCTLLDACSNGVCKGIAIDCSSKNDQCNAGQCQKGTCVAVPKDGSCSNGDPCTENDKCGAGVCKGVKKDCSLWADQCNIGVCSNGQCTKQPAGGGCNDNDLCTTNDVCGNGGCAGTKIDCTYLDDQCSHGKCVNGSCYDQPKEGGCDDGDPCTEWDTCVQGQCKGQQKDCSSEGSQCNDGVCEGGVCTKKAKPEWSWCDDNDPCTDGDHCKGGECVVTPVWCGWMYAECQVGVCSASELKCVLVPVKDGTACSDGDVCTEGDQCSGGNCKPTGSKNCGPNTCTGGVYWKCDPQKGCVSYPCS